jgi:hypothetical protein
MDVIGFLCVSLGSSTVQLHDRVGSRHACAYSEAGFSSRNGVYYRRETFCCAFFCGQKGSMQRILIKKCLLFTVGSVCRVKQFITGSRNFQGRSKATDDVRPGAEVTETTVKTLLRYGFRRIGKGMGQVDQ